MHPLQHRKHKREERETESNRAKSYNTRPLAPPNPWPNNHTQKTFHFTNPKPKIDKLRNPNWGYPITKSVQKAEMKTRTMGSRDVERERGPWRRKLGK